MPRVLSPARSLANRRIVARSSSGSVYIPGPSQSNNGSYATASGLSGLSYGTGPFTISFWVKHRLSRGGASTTSQMFGIVFSTSGTLILGRTFGTNTLTLSGGLTGGLIMTTTVPVRYERWEHYVICADQAGLVFSFYLDGSLLTSGVASLRSGPVGTATVVVGNVTSHIQPGNYADLQYCVGAWPTLAQVQATYYEGAVLPNCLGRWKFDEANGTSSAAVDSVGGNNMGSAGGGALLVPEAPY